MYFCRNYYVLMGITGKIKQKVEYIYRQSIVREQYPMMTPLNRKKLQAEGALGLVYMLHHITVKNKKGIPTNEDLKVSPLFLERIIIKYKKQGFHFVSLDELCKIIHSYKSPDYPFIAFTIDDGYLDNYTKALPVFARQQVPFTIFVASDIIDQKAILWWDILEDLILKNNTLKIGPNEYHCSTFLEKWDVFRILRENILLYEQRQLKTIVVLIRKYCISKFSNSSDWFHILLYFTCVIIATLLSLSIYQLLDRYLPKTKKIFSGNR